MMKLYLKKLLYTALFFLVYILLIWCMAFVGYIILGKVIHKPVATTVIALSAIVIVLRIVYKNRCDSASHKNAFWKILENGYISLGKDFLQTLISKESATHTLAFLTLVFLFSLPIGISSSSNAWTFIVGMILLLGTQGIVFTIGNTFLWCMVHRRWQRIKMSF